MIFPIHMTITSLVHLQSLWQNNTLVQGLQSNLQLFGAVTCNEVIPLINYSFIRIGGVTFIDPHLPQVPTAPHYG